MKVIAFNGSPHMDKGNTALILDPFLDGLREAGAEVELFYTKKLDINPCQGEFNCWFKTPGSCFQCDDMRMLLPKLAEADLWVFATPVFLDGMTGSLKILVDRMLPLIRPLYVLVDGHSRHPRREGTVSGQVVIVSNCGLWEMDNFDPLIAHVKAICKNFDREYAGALLRPHGTGLRRMMESGANLADIFAAAKEAGKQLAENGRMSLETLKAVGRELMTVEQHVQVANEKFQQILNAQGLSL